MSEEMIITTENKLEKMMFQNVRYMERRKNCLFFRGEHVFGGNVIIRVNRNTLDVFWLFEGEFDYKYQFERSLNDIAIA
ncbi:hypothetical protein [Priestia megaterium]|uniref:hypothetical protein n=1 Tax=Priestia megaterium TaxID=1404 RepID=UPI000BFC0558|nr:hypothetical protein [Priestia megaterium]PGQ88250.1 hypothetical protein COA18_04805 [Priestia megaterium]